MDDDKILNGAEAVAYLRVATGLSTNELYKLNGSRPIPHYKIGREFRYSRNELEVWRRGQ